MHELHELTKFILKKKEGRLLVKFNLAFYESGNFAALKKVMYKMQNVLYKCMWVLHLAEIKIFPQKYKKEMENLNETNQLH